MKENYIFFLIMILHQRSYVSCSSSIKSFEEVVKDHQKNIYYLFWREAFTENGKFFLIQNCSNFD